MSTAHCFTCASLVYIMSTMRAYGLCLISFTFDTVPSPLPDEWYAFSIDL